MIQDNDMFRCTVYWALLSWNVASRMNNRPVKIKVPRSLVMTIQSPLDLSLIHSKFGNFHRCSRRNKIDVAD